MNPITTDPARLTEGDRARFWSKVDKNGPIPEIRPELGPCWTWTAGKFERGYGKFKFGGSDKRAPRIAWEMAMGAIPPGMYICHRCDNPPCVNPAHLFPASQRDNIEDARVKNRLSRGSKHMRDAAKLSDFEVREIITRRRAGEKNQTIASRFHITSSYVSKITTGRNWAHISRVPATKADPVPARHA